MGVIGLQKQCFCILLSCFGSWNTLYCPVITFLRYGGLVKIQVKKIASVQMGYSFRARLEADSAGDVAVIQMKDLQEDHTVDCGDLVKVDMKDVKGHHLVRKGDLVLRSRGLVTTSAIVLEEPVAAVVAAPLLRIRVENPGKVLPEYLNWYINQRDAQAFLHSRAIGTAQKMIGKEALDELEVFVPDLSSQKNIVDMASLSAREQLLLHALAEKRDQYISKLLMHFAKGESKI
ncbi:MAG: restriction endonuclease subunit S [Chlorobiales bacterium]|nr:restriction endonuclease subunit S [Chlorobiales bacterium]